MNYKNRTEAFSIGGKQKQENLHQCRCPVQLYTYLKTTVKKTRSPPIGGEAKRRTTRIRPKAVWGGIFAVASDRKLLVTSYPVQM